ncbi:hypothetical protein ASF24_13825 [Methylobacterium sp. Leaf86]|nr:hypothetical protein ASF24_13825 [Methylobacterium sp. Leaf86]
MLLFGEFSRLFDPFTLQAIRDGDAVKLACENYLALSANSPNPTELQAFMTRAVELCRVGSDPAIVGVKPAGLEDFAEVAFFALEVQFRDFLAVALAARSSGETDRAA